MILTGLLAIFFSFFNWLAAIPLLLVFIIACLTRDFLPKPLDSEYQHV